MFDLQLVAQCGMQVLRYHNNDDHGVNTPITHNGEPRGKINVSEN